MLHKYRTGHWLETLAALGCCTMLVSAEPAQPTLPRVPDMNPTLLQASAREINADVLGNLLAEARKTYGKVNDYSCVFVKQERIGGKLLPEQIAYMTVRTEPFSVWMKFASPANLNGQEVCYVAGKNNGKMRVKGSGLKGAIGFITIAVDDSRAMSQNRHTIENAGIGAMIDLIAAAGASGQENKSRTTAAECKFNGRNCYRIEIVQPESDRSYCRRCVIYFDRESSLPVRFEAYDRPTPSNPAGDLIECYSYANLKLNVEAADAVFNR